MLTVFSYVIVQFYVCVPIPKHTSVGERKNIYLWFTLKASDHFASCGRNSAVHLQHKKYLSKKKKNPSNFFRDNRSFSKTIHQINRSLFCLLMSKLPPQISLTYCTCTTTLSISPFCACIWGSTDSCHLQKVFYLTGMHRIHLVKHIRKRRRVSTRE